jgi:hypothetical protein
MEFRKMNESAVARAPVFRTCALAPTSPEGWAELYRATAYHEAGHAVVGYYFGKWVGNEGIRIEHRAKTSGHADVRGDLLTPPPVNSNSWMGRHIDGGLRAECMVLLAGGAAERRARSPLQHGDATDVWRAVKLIMLVRNCTETAAWFALERYRMATKRLVARADIWAAIVAIAAQLERTHHLAGEDANAMFEACATRPVRWTYFFHHR